MYVGGIDALGKGVLDRAPDDLAEACSLYSVKAGMNSDLGAPRPMRCGAKLPRVSNPGSMPDSAAPSFLESEYVAVVLANRITLEQYAKVPGRGCRESAAADRAVETRRSIRRHSQMDETISFPKFWLRSPRCCDLRGRRWCYQPTTSSSTRRETCTPPIGRCRALVGEGPTICSSQRTAPTNLRKSNVLSRFGIKISGRPAGSP